MPSKSYCTVNLSKRELYVRTVNTEETKGIIKSDNNDAIVDAIESINRNRVQLKEYITRHPLFFYSLKPVDPLIDAPKIAVKMAEASEKANVGPMASVAGALIDEALTIMMNRKPSIALLENGGEIAAYSKKPIKIMIYAGSRTSLGRKLGFTLHKFPIGVATSSASVGDALTFGEADSATIIAENAALADAAATAACNEVKGSSITESVKKALTKVEQIEGVKSAIIIRKEQVGIGGEYPDMFLVKDT